MENSNFIAFNLINWFKSNKRHLPWRETKNPYKIWISEIILQQTRVAQGLEFYRRFIDRFPNIQTLADADEQEVLKYWQGLGYYSRARNLHATAKIIRDRYAGIFPNDYQLVLSLKGIGEYTAAAIVSLVWNQPYPVVDGNVFRFLSRLFLIDEPIDTSKGKKYFTNLAGDLMDKTQSGLFNQAIMEFGALQCVPSSPDCSICPFNLQCLATIRRLVAEYPVKQNKAKTKKLYLYYFHIHWKNYIYIYKRKEKGIWQNLFEFPLIESEMEIEPEKLLTSKFIADWLPAEDVISFSEVIRNRKHILSHRTLYATFLEVFINKKPTIPETFIQIEEKDIESYPVHRLMQYYIEVVING